MWHESSGAGELGCVEWSGSCLPPELPLLPHPKKGEFRKTGDIIGKEDGQWYLLEQG